MQLLPRVFAPVNRLLDPMERRWVAGGGSFPSPPVFILGPPRCGSTLLAQLLFAHFHAGGLRNLHCTFSGAPTLVERVAGTWMAADTSPDFTSDHGRTAGLRAPAECGAFWYRWFPRRPQHATAADIDEAALASLRAILIRLGELQRVPMVFKNLVHAVRLAPLLRAVPEARFIIVQRDDVDVARSILRARQRLRGDARKWWSVEPAGFEAQLGRPAEFQVAWQIRAVRDAIRLGTSGLAADRVTTLNYAAMCDDVPREMDRLGEWYAGCGTRLRPRGWAAPRRFAAASRPGDGAEEDRLQKALAEVS